MNALTAQHALFWLLAGNLAGVWLALLLLFPELNRLFGEFTYGRIVPLHLDFQLYGWTSLPLVLWLLKLFDCEDRTGPRAAVAIWSCAVAAGGGSSLAGESSGKIFLEWAGFPRALFAVALLFLWFVLAGGFVRALPRPGWERAVKTATLALLLSVVPVWFWAASPSVYPAVNPRTSGPTAASLLGSTLVVVLLLLLAAPLLGQPKSGSGKPRIAWAVFACQLVVFALANKHNRSHWSLSQIALLGLLLLWAPLLPSYFNGFVFAERSRSWLRAALLWFGLLAFTGWISFLPKVLDAWKFTDALVAHSHLAMAGFVTAFDLFLLTRLAGLRASRRSFWIWNSAALVYVLAMWVAGIMEAADPAFTIVPNSARTVLYTLRLFAGLAMAGCSLHWWLAALELKSERPLEWAAPVPVA